ncbi:MAG: hypothetical protein IH986_06190 [Planctomycetes bacterium]|nr:hypothetical protein [Planctomycetota bacterium]
MGPIEAILAVQPLAEVTLVSTETSGAPVAVLVRAVHIAAAAMMIGAVAFQLFALRPALLAVEESKRAELREAIIGRWRRFVLAAIAILFVTGMLNFVFKLLAYRGHPLIGVYHGVFAVKLLAAFHAATVLVMPGPRFDRYRARAGFWLTYLLVLFALIILLGGVLNGFLDLFGPMPAVTTQPTG